MFAGSVCDRWTDRQMDGQIDGWTDRQMDIQAGRQTDKNKTICPMIFQCSLLPMISPFPTCFQWTCIADMLKNNPACLGKV